MGYILGLFPNFAESFRALWWAFSHGGWVVFVIVAVYILYKLYRFEITGQFIKDQEWVFLQIRAPRENTISSLAVEQIYGQLHALHSSLTWPQQVIEGRIQLWYSFEIVSLGGKVSMIMRVPKKLRDTVEAAFYSQYPNAEITEVRDYLENVEYHPGHSDFDLFGCEMKVLQPQVIPIKTYKEFEHPTAENKIIDPLSPLFESMAKMEPHEFFGVQIIAQPLADDEWKQQAENKARELLGEEVEHAHGLKEMIIEGLQLYNPFHWLEQMFSGGGHEEHEEEGKKEKNNLMHMTEVEKERVNAIQRKSGKPGYQCKIRLLYMAPSDKFDSTKKTIIIGAFRTLGDAQTNGFKPDTKETWTGLEYKVSPSLEAPWINRVVNKRKHHIFEGYKERHIFIGRPPFILNIEELATIFHLPLAPEGATTSPAIERVESKKSQAPINLPVG